METVELIRPQFNSDGIIIKTNLSENIPSSFYDVDQIKEAIVNLLLNSKQAIGNKGIITISTKILKLNSDLTDYSYHNSVTNIHDSKDYKITLEKGTDNIYLEIADNGNGIPHKNINKIFDPFFTTKENGTGLGLAMVKRTVNNHYGIVKVKSELNSGTIISLLFPIKEKI